MVGLLEPHTEADSVALLAQLLNAFGNVIGRKAHFVAEADYHAMNLFVALVGGQPRGARELLGLCKKVISSCRRWMGFYPHSIRHVIREKALYGRFGTRHLRARMLQKS